ncbi:MAG: 6-phosphogluconolactonase [Pyrinomonadaceae bacterium]
MKSDRIRVLSDLSAVSRAGAEEFLTVGNRAIGREDRFAVALAGGSTPRELHRLLAGDEFRGEIDWSKVFFFFGDERDVSPDSIQSNFLMAKETLFDPLEIAPENINRWPTEILDPIETAGCYQKRIIQFFELQTGQFPRFDLIFLGMGDDGHTASLFPHTEALSETEKIAVANPVEKLDSYRLTLTYPAINGAVKLVFLVSGEKKAKTLTQVLEGDYQPDRFPSQAVKPSDGDLLWLVDEAAAALLKG